MYSSYATIVHILVTSFGYYYYMYTCNKLSCYVSMPLTYSLSCLQTMPCYSIDGSSDRLHCGRVANHEASMLELDDSENIIQ